MAAEVEARRQEQEKREAENMVRQQQKEEANMSLKKPKQNGGIETNGNTPAGEGTPGKPTSVHTNGAVTPIDTPQDPNAWTTAQQKQLEKGMRAAPSSIPTKERWIQVAELVDGKTPKECFERFKELTAKVKGVK